MAINTTPKWSGLLAMTLLATSTASYAQTIDYLMSTKHDFLKSMDVTQPKVEFKEGMPLDKSVDASGSKPAMVGLSIDDSEHFQTMEYIGGSITDSTGIALGDVRKANPEVYCEILNMLYSQKDEWLRVGGAGMNSVRHPLGSTDFSLQYYTLDDPQKCGAPFRGDLKYFNLQGSSPKLWQTILDIKEIVEAGDDGQVGPGNKLSTRTLSWSANPAAKTNNSYTGKGRLKEEYEDYYVNYLYRSVQELCKLKICPEFLSLQESPQNADDVIPSMQVPPEQAARLATALWKKISEDEELKKMYEGMPLKLCALEASWSESDYQYAHTVLEAAGNAFGATCWQGYSGYNATVQELIAKKYHKKTLFTEMTYTLSPEPWGNLRDFLFKVGVNAIQRGSSDVNVWQQALKTNEALDQTFPSLKGACDSCIASVLILPKATRNLDSQTQQAYCQKDTPRVDWLTIDNKIAAGKGISAEQVQQLNNIKVDNNGKEVGLGIITSAAGYSKLPINGNGLGKDSYTVDDREGPSDPNGFQGRPHEVPGGPKGTGNLGGEADGSGDANVNGLTHPTKRSFIKRIRRAVNTGGNSGTTKPTDPLLAEGKETNGVETGNGKATSNKETTGPHNGNGEQNNDRQTINGDETTLGKQANSDDNDDGEKIPFQSPDTCFKQRNMGFKYEPSHCSAQRAPARRGGQGIYGPNGYYARTSQLDFVGHLGAAVSARKGWGQGIRIGISSTDSPSDQDVVNGKIMATAFEQPSLAKDGTSRFCLLMLNWNDNNQKKFESVTAVISFRGKVAELTTDPGVYTACWTAESSKPSTETKPLTGSRIESGNPDVEGKTGKKDDVDTGNAELTPGHEVSKGPILL